MAWGITCLCRPRRQLHPRGVRLGPSPHPALPGSGRGGILQPFLTRLQCSLLPAQPVPHPQPPYQLCDRSRGLGFPTGTGPTSDNGHMLRTPALAISLSISSFKKGSRRRAGKTVSRPVKVEHRERRLVQGGHRHRTRSDGAEEGNPTAWLPPQMSCDPRVTTQPL